MKKNLILTGMMGVGKTAIGKSLSDRLKMKFFDIDRLIEDREKKTIVEIFDVKGEKYFRELEREISLKTLSNFQSVIALGGGSFEDTAIRKKILKTSLSFWLDLKTESLIMRLKNSKKRPLLNKKSLHKTINEIYQKRKSIYNQANYKVNCNNASKQSIVKKIVKIYEIERNKS